MWALNLSLFRAINGWPQSMAPFWRFFSEAMNYWWFKLAVLVLVAWLIALGDVRRRTAIQALIAVGIGNFFTDCFKRSLPEHRPFQEIPDVIMRAGTSSSYGTASAHAANMAAVAFVFTYGLRWWGAPWIAIALLTGISRVYVGVHYPYQVMLGWSCGIGSGLLVTKTWEWIVNRRSNVVESKDAAGAHV